MEARTRRTPEERLALVRARGNDRTLLAPYTMGGRSCYRASAHSGLTTGKPGWFVILGRPAAQPPSSR